MPVESEPTFTESEKQLLHTIEHGPVQPTLHRFEAVLSE